MSFAQSLVASTLRVSPFSLARAARAKYDNLRATRSTGSFLYRDTATRARMRRLFDAAGEIGAICLIVFIKNDGSARPMVARVCPGVDNTCAYVTVVDLEKSDAAGCDVFRRVSLDSVASLRIDFEA